MFEGFDYDGWEELDFLEGRCLPSESEDSDYVDFYDDSDTINEKAMYYKEQEEEETRQFNVLLDFLMMVLHDYDLHK